MVIVVADPRCKACDVGEVLYMRSVLQDVIGQYTGYITLSGRSSEYEIGRRVEYSRVKGPISRSVPLIPVYQNCTVAILQLTHGP